MAAILPSRGVVHCSTHYVYLECKKIITFFRSTESRLRYCDTVTKILTMLVLPEYLSDRTSVCDIWPDITTYFLVVVALFYEYLSNKMLNRGSIKDFHGD